MAEHAPWNVALSRENHIFSELLWILHEKVSLLLVSEEVEQVLVEDAELRLVRASDELLLSLPRDWAVVAVLGDRLLEVNTVHVEVCNAAWALRGAADVLVVLGKSHTCLDVVADGANGDILDEPF